MRKEELQALGITDSETIRQLQVIHGRDMAKLKRKVKLREEIAAEPLRKAIAGIVEVLDANESLRRVLSAATTAYYLERKKAEASEIPAVSERPVAPELPEKQEPAPSEEQQPEQGAEE